MGTPYLAEIRVMSFNFAPKGWATCNGQTLQINQNQALFALLGTMYGGNGQTTFALPNMQGRAPMSFGSGHTLGERGGEEAHTVTASELPVHNHFLYGQGIIADSTAGNAIGTGKYVAEAYVPQGGGQTPLNLYGTGTPDRTMSASTLSNVGNTQPHENRQPFLTLNMCIALQGVFPSQT